jgi:NAD(P)H-flavin reductase
MTRANVERLHEDILHVKVSAPRPWQFKAGQHVRICFPGVSYSSWTQWHPFMVSTWHVEDDQSFIILFISQMNGLTRRLGDHVGKGELMALVDGPYGESVPLRDYETVLLFASGIGIAGQSSYVKQLLEDHELGRTVRRSGSITLFWQIDTEGSYILGAIGTY